jgi:CheY-like chemotaxis protein
MTTFFQSRRKVLFIDDDPRFLEAMTRVMGVLSHGSWEIFGAETTSAAFTLLQEQSIHLAVIDVQMPVTDGLQFLRLLNRRYPNLQKVVLTGFGASETYRATCLSSGAELFLEKPKTSAEQETLFTTLNELLKWQPEDGFRGVLRRVGLQDVIQMECLGRNSAILEVKAGRHQGRIYIKDGQIVHAAVGDHKGEEAFLYLLGLRRGEFVMKTFTEPPEQTIDTSYEMLLMEAARLQDEAIQAAGARTLALASGETEFFPWRPASPPSHTLQPLLPGTETVAPIESLAGSPTPPAATARAGGTTWIRRTLAGGLPNRANAPASIDRTRIEEILICTAQGEVLYGWHCPSSDVWVNFLEFVSQKARRLSQGLTLGNFDRLEASGADAHLIALVSAHQGILVRSRSDPEPGNRETRADPEPPAPGPGPAAAA